MRHTFLLLLPLLAAAQTWTDIPASATSYQSFNGESEAQEFGWTWYLGFPAGNTGVPDSECVVQPGFTYYLQSAESEENPTQSVWQLQPPFTQWWRNVGAVYRSAPQPNVRGIRFLGAFSGSISSTSDTRWNFVDEAVYYHKNRCYDGGPEFGFYRILIHPWDIDEMTNVYFYYSANTNCGDQQKYLLEPDGIFANVSGCNTLDGQPINQYVGPAPVTPSAPYGNSLKIPLWVNSRGTLLYNYSAYLADAGNFFITITDPYTGECAYCSNVPVQPWFAGHAQDMLNGNQSGYLDIAIQNGTAHDWQHHYFGTMTSSWYDWASVGVQTLAVAPR
ncbi:MAG: hypothetical protein U0Q18_03415 [Bryobacteraceae bacterium]